MPLTKSSILFFNGAISEKKIEIGAQKLKTLFSERELFLI